MKKFAVIGKPVAHSLSPLLHNYWFDKYKIEAEYSMLEIDEADIESILAKVKSREISGINVTLPYKKKIITDLDFVFLITSKEEKMKMKKSTNMKIYYLKILLYPIFLKT